ncbi:MAG: hypothetical protein U0271_15140 [Polyangiaceae bacterium]
MSQPELEAFELELLGGGIEHRYRRMRPEVEAMPWDSFDPSLYDADVLVAARSAWTRAAFQEHRTAAACALALRTLIETRAPLDLVGLATRFPLDEIVHVELCARMATVAGGGTEIRHRPDDLIKDPPEGLSPLARAADIVTRVFCVGEALSIPLLRGAWHAAKHPLPRAILGRIVRDEAAHGTFGFTFLDWALPQMNASERASVGHAADRAISSIHALWREIAAGAEPLDSTAHPLGWMRTDSYLALAERSMRSRVIEPLRARGVALATAS